MNTCDYMNTRPETIKKSRAAAHAWKKFYQLATGDTFFIGKTSFRKTSLFTAISPSSGKWRYVSPFRRVRTQEMKHTTHTIKGTVTGRPSTAPFVALPDPQLRGTTGQPSSDNAITGPTS